MTSHSHTVLIVDDVPENLAYLHDALDESGYQVYVANSGEMALQVAHLMQPHVILMDAMMPGLDGFATCRRIKAATETQHIPVIFMTGLTEIEHVTMAFDAGGVDYVTKPVRPAEVLARLKVHVQNATKMHQATTALDAFGQATIAILPTDKRLVWQTPLAKHYLAQYFAEWAAKEAYSAVQTLPPMIYQWLESSIQQFSSGQSMQTLSVNQGSARLSLTVANTSEEQWVVVLREHSDEAQIESLGKLFQLTKRESEVLYWTVKGKTNKDVGEILGTSPRTINKHLEHVFQKLGVETRTAAASLVASKIKF
ncbi:response regulator transcription factor [Methylophilus sp.]|jgi:DNA-binding response OmpR family regulator/DNA-binding CsgD family transcriptional regulator|uniref:response regulator transcription factor n=1 Tax=Methylophilus sp. TaxID=29541 RepID=UPI0011D3F79A|nr:response regulator transcription factor [Methylophilus sp.]TXI46533.1 MAG: response regulator [Methylophilus sp.]